MKWAITVNLIGRCNTLSSAILKKKKIDWSDGLFFGYLAKAMFI